MKKPKPTYKQKWPEYNAAQTNEKDKFQMLLADLCRGIVDDTPRTKRPAPAAISSRRRNGKALPKPGCGDWRYCQ